MEEKFEPIPENMTVLEASEFWDNHSLADYPSQIVEMEYAPTDRVAIVAIASDMISQLEKRAEESGVSIETLVNLWVQEKLQVA
ncbi:MAG: CopG family antitoxin [Chloroflexota bacterium]